MNHTITETDLRPDTAAISLAIQATVSSEVAGSTIDRAFADNFGMSAVHVARRSANTLASIPPGLSAVLSMNGSADEISTSDATRSPPCRRKYRAISAAPSNAQREFRGPRRLAS